MDYLDALQMTDAPADAFSAGDWCYAANVLAQRVKELERERELGEQTQECLDRTCSVQTVGSGYDSCPRCGGALVSLAGPV